MHKRTFHALFASAVNEAARRLNKTALSRLPARSCGRLSVILGLVFLLPALPWLTLGRSPATAQDDDAAARQIVERSLGPIKRDFEAALQFECSERDQDANGSRTYRDLIIDGSDYQQLVAINDKPLSREKQAQEAQKLRNETARRQKQSRPERAQRIARFQADQKRDHDLLAELTKAFNFKLAGVDHLGGHEVYVLHATPRPGYRPINRDTQVLTGMKGTLWIEQKSFQWVKVEAEVTHPVAIEGFVARVEPGTRFELEKMPVAPGIWLARHFSMKSRSRVFYLFPHQKSEDQRYSDYRRISSLASTTESQPQSSRP